MKKLFLLLLLILWITRVEAQVVTTTPNLGMSKPCVPGDAGCDPLGHPNWGPIINSNFDILDARVPRVTPDRVTVATKPSIPLVDEIVIVTDSNSATDCATAGGTTKVICQWTGSAWQAIGGGGGGGGSSAFNDLTSGSNTTAAMVVGTGASLAPTGSGSIQATLLGASTLVALSLCSPGVAARGINSDGTPACNGNSYQPLNSNLNIFAGITPSANIQTFLAAANYSAALTLLSPKLATIAGLTPTNDSIIVGNNAGTDWEAKTFPPCTDTAGQHINWNDGPSCGNSTATPAWTEDTDSLNSTKDLEIGTVTSGIKITHSGLAALRTLTWDIDANGTLAGTSGSRTSGDCSKFASTGLLVSAGSCRKVVQLQPFDPTTDVTTGDGAMYFLVPATLNGMNLVAATANVVTAGTTGTTDIQIARCAAAASGNACSGTVSDMLSTKITIDSGENATTTAAAAAVINTSNDDVSTGQVLRIDVDAVSTTKPKGLVINLSFELP